MKTRFFSNYSWQNKFMFRSFTRRRWQAHSRCYFYDKVSEFSLFCFTVDFFVCTVILCSDFTACFFFDICQRMRTIQFNETRYGSAFRRRFQANPLLLHFSPCNLMHFKTGKWGAFKLASSVHLLSAACWDWLRVEQDTSQCTQESTLWPEAGSDLRSVLATSALS